LTSATLRDRMSAALPDAIRSRDRTAVAALRSTLAALANAEAVGVGGRDDPSATGSEHVAAAAAGVGAAEVSRRVLAEAEVVSLVRAEVEERLESAGVYDLHGQADRAERLRAEASVISAYLD